MSPCLVRAGDITGEIDALVKELNRPVLSKSIRIEIASSHFLGKPYVVDPLGEGESGRFDQDPQLRTDAFDCTTFVETVMGAVGAARNPGSGYIEFKNQLDFIRYDHGRISYETRNHFPELDWIPHNTQLGVVRDFTAEFAQSHETLEGSSTAKIDRRAWYEHKTDKDLNVVGLSAEERKARVLEWRAMGALSVPVRASIPYLKTQDAIRLAAEIPSGTLIHFVRENWSVPSQGTPLIISHQAFVIQKTTPNGIVTVMRHASKDKHVVMDVDFKEYFSKLVGHETIRGIELLELFP